MCLTGVDYFSTLGYQPGIAALAAGALSPLATFILILLTLFGALPIYRRVATLSPHGEGSIAIAVVLVIIYLSLNLVVISVGIYQISQNPTVITDWHHSLFQAHSNPLVTIAIAALLFPKLALGLSGFKTGVAVMPLVKGSPNDTEANLQGRIHNTYNLLTVAAVTMSFFLLLSSFVTTCLISPAEFQPGGVANGRALAYLSHYYLGNTFGTIYDFSTVLILWFAGASAMAGLLNIVPRYLPRNGM